MRRRTRTAALALLLATASIVATAGAQERGPTPASPQDLQAAVGKLGDIDYATRVKAGRVIRRAPGAAAVPVLLQAAREHADGYIRFKALVLLVGFADPRTLDAMEESLGLAEMIGCAKWLMASSTSRRPGWRCDCSRRLTRRRASSRRLFAGPSACCDGAYQPAGSRRADSRRHARPGLLPELGDRSTVHAEQIATALPRLLEHRKGRGSATMRRRARQAGYKAAPQRFRELQRTGSQVLQPSVAAAIWAAWRELLVASRVHPVRLASPRTFPATRMHSQLRGGAWP